MLSEMIQVSKLNLKVIADLVEFSSDYNFFFFDQILLRLYQERSF